jgi:Tol biopolymer transport system component
LSYFVLFCVVLHKYNIALRNNPNKKQYFFCETQDLDKLHKMAKTIKYYSVEELDYLIESIKKAEKLNEGQIAARMGYNEGYLAQVKSRGQIPAKLMNALQREFTLRKATSEVSEPQVVYGNSTVASLADSVKSLSQTELINAENIRRLITLLEIKIMEAPAPQAPFRDLRKEQIKASSHKR